MPKITITHQEEKTQHTFTVKNPDRLTQAEVNRICHTARFNALFVNNRYYEMNEPLDFDLYLKYNKIKQKCPKK
jgi:hypothetical protein